MKHDVDSIRYKIFKTVFIVGIFMSFSVCLMNFLLSLKTLDTVLTFICGVITVGLYIAFRITGNIEKLTLSVVIFLSFIFFPTMWLVSGGTYSSMPYYFIINAAIISLLLIGLQRKIIFFLYVLLVGGLIVAEYKMPDVIYPGFDSELVRYIDLAFGLFISLFSISTLIAVLIDSYMDELKKSRQYLATLEEKNREIEAKNEMLEKSNAELMKAKEETEKLNKLLNDEKQKLKKLSITDYPTGAYNKRFITTFLSEEIESSQEKQKKLTVAMVDIDNFKQINDTYGHVYGDHVLEKVAGTIISNLRQNDIVGRYGGDEFIIILPDTGREEGFATMERIRRKILEMEWENDITVTISGAVMEVGSNELTSLLQKVDQLLYRAKNKSKNIIETEVSG